MESVSEFIDRAIKLLPIQSTCPGKDATYRVLFLLPRNLWRPLKASWWKGKEVCVIGGDPEGNYFLRHPDGSVSIWHHARNIDEVLAPSVRAFTTMLQPPGNA